MKLSEFARILRDLNCPLLLKEDSWWLEGILFKPGKARKDLLQWILEQLSQTNKREEHPTITSSTEGKTDSATETSTVSSGIGVPETDEGLLKYCVKAGLCAIEDLDLITGNASVEKQTELWTVLLTSLCATSAKHEEPAVSLNYLSDITQSSNFLELFKLKSDLIPSVLKIELKRWNQIFTRDGLQNELLRPQHDSCTYLEEEGEPICSITYEKLLDVQSRLQSAAGIFAENCKADLRGRGLATSLPSESEQLGVNCTTLNKQISTWSQSVAYLQKLQSNMEELTDLAKTQKHVSESSTVTNEFLGELCKVWLK